MVRIYLDSNILLSKIAGPIKEPRENPLAEKVFEKLKNENIEVVISPLTLMEVKSILKNDQIQDKETLEKMSDEQRVNHVLKESNTAYNNMLGELLSMKDKVIFKVEKQIDMNAVLSNAVLLVDFVKGKVKFRNECKKCGSDDVAFFSYKSLATYDAFHILLSKEMDCDEFWTFDGDFDEIQHHEKVYPLKIRNIRVEPIK